jgi:hypothetical protein
MQRYQVAVPTGACHRADGHCFVQRYAKGLVTILCRTKFWVASAGVGSSCRCPSNPSAPTGARPSPSRGRLAGGFCLRAPAQGVCRYANCANTAAASAPTPATSQCFHRARLRPSPRCRRRRPRLGHWSRPPPQTRRPVRQPHCRGPNRLSHIIIQRIGQPALTYSTSVKLSPSPPSPSAPD